MRCRSRRHARFQGKGEERQPSPQSQFAGHWIQFVRIANLHAAFTTSGDWIIGWRANELSGSYTTLNSRPCAAPNPWQIGDSRKYSAVSASRSSIVNVGNASAIVLV